MNAKKHGLLRNLALGAPALCGLICWNTPSDAGVTQIIIDSTTPVSGAPIPYETLTGRVFGELDPNSSYNNIIQDIGLAPREKNGDVQYIATFQITTPVSPAQRTGLMIYEVSNRGGTAIPAASSLISGVTYVQSGWQGDLLANCTTPYPCISLAAGPYNPADVSGSPLEVLQVPVAHKADGSSITGPVYSRITNASGNTAQLIIFTTPVPYKPLSLVTSQSQFTSTTSQATDGTDGAKTQIPSSDWAWANCATTPFPGTPDPTRICMKNGFNPNLLYQMVFTAKDPLVLGVGYAATRDLISFLRYETSDDKGTANPIAGSIHKVISDGVSQSAAFLRATIFYGFNQDESRRMVSNGAWSEIDGRMLFMNSRFALPDVLLEPFMMGDEAPVWWSDFPNLARNFPPAGLLDACKASNTCPEIMESFGSAEFYTEKMSPDLIGMTAVSDIPLPPNVHRYYEPGTTHGGGGGGFTFTPNPPAVSGSNFAANPNPESDTDNALLSDFIAFLMNDTPMPPSVYPTLREHQLVPATQRDEGFPNIPGFPFGGTGQWPALEYNFGPNIDYMNQTGFATIQPPLVERVLPTFAPTVNSDGNETSGIPSVLLQAPLGTYVGWNTIATGALEGQDTALTGAFFPFEETLAERVAAKDPRPSLEERYGTHAGYVCVVTRAADKNVSERFLLRSAATTMISEAEASNVLSGVTPTKADQDLANALCKSGGREPSGGPQFP
jgi:Alpha/beta hydrolase domain